MRKKILILAYACLPGKGSEPGVGWNFAKEMAVYYDVWVITREENRSLIERAIEDEPIPGLNFLYHNVPKSSAWWKRGSAGLQIHYYFWQLTVPRFLEEMHRKICFDIVHHLTYTKYWAPSGARKMKIPFIWGPVGGGESMPKPFWSSLSVKAKIYEKTRTIARMIGEIDPALVKTAANAKLGFATTPETQERMQRLSGCKIEKMTSIAVPSDEFEKLKSFSKSTSTFEARKKYTFVGIGRLFGWKGYHLVFHAFAKAYLPDENIVILGSGPESNNLKELAKTLGIDDRVIFLSNINRDEVLQLLLNAKVFVHPSLHESGGMVILEAMSAELPVICFDIGGPAVLVNNSVGRKIPAITPDQAIEDLSKAMRELATNDELRERLGSSAQESVAANFTWKAKAEQFAKIYEQILSKEQGLEPSDPEEARSA